MTDRDDKQVILWILSWYRVVDKPVANNTRTTLDYLIVQTFSRFPFPIYWLFTQSITLLVIAIMFAHLLASISFKLETRQVFLKLS